MHGSSSSRSLTAAAAALVLLAAARHAVAEERWRVFVEGGQASAPKSVRFAEFAGVAVARDLPLTGRLGASVEAYPVLLVNQTRTDHVTRERVGAVAGGLLLTFDVGRSGASWGLRLEAGAGLLWGFGPIPASGSRFNFLDQGGARLVRRLDGGGSLSAGYRRAHVSNLGLAGDDNPGLSFHSLVLAYGW